MTDMIYHDLDVETQEIRLVHILPGTKGSVVRCTLQTARLAECTFDTLSYCWGAPGGTSKVVLDTVEVPANESLNNALHHLRKLGIASSRPIWVDAICINQHDDAERSSQVALMDTIYRRATVVHVWLGTASEVSLGTMEALQDFHVYPGCGSPSFTGGIRPGHVHSPEARAQHLLSLTQNPYWQRTWVMQEVNLAHTCIVHGHETYVLLDRISNSSPLYPILSPLQTSQDNDRTLDQDNPILPVVTAGFASLIRPIAHEPAYVRLLPEILRCFRPLLASDPRDRVYGILGLLPTTLNITPDYTKSVGELYTDFTVEVVKATRSLVVFNDAWSGSSDLPSWVPDLRRPCHPEGLLAKYNASAYVPAEIRVVGDGMLAAKGLVLDTVAAIEEGSADSAGPSDRERRQAFFDRFLKDQRESKRARIDRDYLPAFKGSVLNDMAAVKETSARSADPLKVERYADPLDVERWQAFLNRFLARGHMSERESAALSSHLHWLTHLDTEQQERLILTNSETLLNRDMSRVFRENDLFTTTAGRIGNAPRGHATPGDQLVLLAGANVPFITTTASSSGESANAFTLKAPGILWDTPEVWVDGCLDGHDSEIMNGAWLMRRAGLHTIFEAQEEVGQQAILDLFGDVLIC